MDATEFYSNFENRNDLSFNDVSRKQTQELTHSYHKYPAKFIPQLARALLGEFSSDGQVVWDPFCGSGTLNIEAYQMGRDSIGTDINPIAVLISRAKSNKYEPRKLDKFINKLNSQINTIKIRNRDFYLEKSILNGNLPILKKWYTDKNLLELSHILWSIKELNAGRKWEDFALCAFSAILKISSFWLIRSNKPQIDPDRIPQSALQLFRTQIKKMVSINQEYYKKNKDNTTTISIREHDATKFINSPYNIDTVITSPPYLVSYDYADLFRLSTYFLSEYENYSTFRKQFIGTTLINGMKEFEKMKEYTNPYLCHINDNQKIKQLNEYFIKMRHFFRNMKRMVKPYGSINIIVGDTKFRGRNIPNAYILSKIAEEEGLHLIQQYERSIPSRILPAIRDKNTGKFSTRKNPNHRIMYKREFILRFRTGLM